MSLLPHKLHNELHVVRRYKDYNATEFERKISSIILEYYVDKCEECKAVKLVGNIDKTKAPASGFLAKIGQWANSRQGIE